MVFNSLKLCQMPKIRPEFLPALRKCSLRLHCSASEIKWRRIGNVNETIVMKLLDPYINQAAAFRVLCARSTKEQSDESSV